jgi:leucyl aminopeptidase (aminopeptidase T)
MRRQGTARAALDDARAYIVRPIDDLAASGDSRERGAILRGSMADPGLAHAAQVLVESALRLAPGERVVLIEDAASLDLGDAIASAIEASGGWVKRAPLDRLASVGCAGRPHKLIPDLLILALHDAHASVFIASAQPAELTMRQALLHVARQRNLRHAHLPGVSTAAFVAGMRLDYAQVERVGRRVLGRLAGVTSLLAESPAGTSLRVELPPDARWFAQLGVLEPGRWGNLPAGALYTSPLSASGVFVADASLGEFFGAREGVLGGNAVRFLVDRGRVVDVQARSAQLKNDIEAMLRVSPNSDRIGLVSIGVNPGLEAPMGDALVDQNLPGLHLGIGDPAARATGATWSAPTCFAACGTGSRVVAGGEVIVESGRIVLASRPRMAAACGPRDTARALRISTPVPGSR